MCSFSRKNMSIWCFLLVVMSSFYAAIFHLAFFHSKLYFWEESMMLEIDLETWLSTANTRASRLRTCTQISYFHYAWPMRFYVWCLVSLQGEVRITYALKEPVFGWRTVYEQCLTQSKWARNVEPNALDYRLIWRRSTCLQYGVSSPRKWDVMPQSSRSFIF